ncbi:MAG: hypothetical protein KBD56_03100 [Candidatus Eisenbacteria bacterium]|nr:hypothetical protein [Candidatus Eisenbacteria bacterium]
MSRRRKPRSKGFGRIPAGAFLLLGFAAVIAIIVLLANARWGSQGTRSVEPAAAPAAAPKPLPPPASERPDLLARILAGRAEWRQTGTPGNMEWLGTLPDGSGLVKWNSDLTAAVQEAGLEVLTGREEVLERKGRWPLQRLTVEVGAAGEYLATVVVETARPPSLPAAF